MKKYLLVLTAVVVFAALLTGCGGGGGGENHSMSGSVTDIAGNLVPGAEIYLDNQKVTTSLANGTFKATNLSTGLHNVEARAWIDGHLWVGTRDIEVFTDGPTMNLGIIIGRYDELGEITGTVTDASNNPIPNAKVVATARYPQDREANEASIVSKVTTTDYMGRYHLYDMPAGIVVNGSTEEIVYDVTASSAGLSGQPRGFENLTKTATVSSDTNLVTIVDFRLVSASSTVPSVPTGWSDPGQIDVISYTVPTAIPSRSAQSAYDAVKSCISEKTAKAVAFKNKFKTRSTPAGSLVENDVIWYYIWNTYYGFTVPENLAGFAIYRATTSSLTKSSMYQLDFFRDPTIVSYADTSNSLTPGTTYYYGVTAVSTSYLDANDEFNPVAESAMTYPASVTPIGQLRSTSPINGALVDRNDAVFSWTPSAGARSYKVYIYDTYPILDSMFTPQGDPERPDHLPAWGESSQTTGTSVTFSDPNFPLVAGHTYWWIVLGSNSTTFDSGNAYALSELRSFEAR